MGVNTSPSSQLLERGPAWDATGSDWNHDSCWSWTSPGTGPGTGPGTLVLLFQITCKPVLGPVPGPVPGLPRPCKPGVSAGIGSHFKLLWCHLKPLQTPFRTGTRVSGHWTGSQVPVTPCNRLRGTAQRGFGANRPVRLLTDELPSV